MNGKEEEIYNILYKKKEINDKTPNLRTEDDKKKLKSLSYKIRKFPKDLIDDIKTKFPLLYLKYIVGPLSIHYSLEYPLPLPLVFNNICDQNVSHMDTIYVTCRVFLMVFLGPFSFTVIYSYM